jgi:hypothetical protein
MVEKQLRCHSCRRVRGGDSARRNFRRQSNLVSCIVVIGVVACGNPPPCYGVHVGDRFAITVVDTYSEPVGRESYDAGRADICGFGFDVSQGEVLTATDAENIPTSDGACTGPIARFAPFGSWTWTLEGTQTSGSQFILAGEYSATNGVCAGHAQVTLTVSSGANPFAPSAPGQTPNVYMTRSFGGSGPGCPTSCVGSFVVNLMRL